MNTPPALLLIDGFNLLSRAYFATSYNRAPEQLMNTNGIYVNALRVFYQKLFNLIRDHQITHLSIVWDVKREELFRRQTYPFYKATRNELPESLLLQYDTCKEITESAGIHQIALPPYEADDLIGTISKRWTSGNCLIYSNDRDLFQLLSETTSQIVANKKGDTIYTQRDFQEEFGIQPEQWVDVKALLGDKSDNIPGCPGIGEKSALPLIQHYSSLEQIYENIDELDSTLARHKKKLEAGKDTAFLSKELSTIVCEINELELVPADELGLSIDTDILLDKLHELELKINIDLRQLS